MYEKATFLKLFFLFEFILLDNNDNVYSWEKNRRSYNIYITFFYDMMLPKSLFFVLKNELRVAKRLLKKQEHFDGNEYLPFSLN